MSDPWGWFVALPAAYLLGSIPFGILISKYFSGVDVRKVGSGGTGATNVLRTSGKLAASLALILDGAKGAAAIVIAKLVADGYSPGLESAAGLIALAGHNWPLFASFRGGKGVTTGWAAVSVMSPWVALACSAGLLATGITRYVSLGSIVGATAGLVFFAVQVVAFDFGGYGYLIFIVGGALIVWWRHIPNIGRMIRGEENKLGQRVKLDRPPTSTA